MSPLKGPVFLVMELLVKRSENQRFWKSFVGEWKSDHGNISVKGGSVLPQKTLLFSRLTVEEHFSILRQLWNEKAALFSRTITDASFHFKKYRSERNRRLVAELCKKCSLRLRCFIQPALLILDEPYNGFDWILTLGLWDYTNQLKTEGCAILIVTPSYHWKGTIWQSL